LELPRLLLHQVLLVQFLVHQLLVHQLLPHQLPLPQLLLDQLPPHLRRLLFLFRLLQRIGRLRIMPSSVD